MIKKNQLLKKWARTIAFANNSSDVIISITKQAIIIFLYLLGVALSKNVCIWGDFPREKKNTPVSLENQRLIFLSGLKYRTEVPCSVMDILSE